ncbi:hypothetical protein, partial [Magnetospirillum sp. SS-4]|uniref:hypothetical protein n=1 Tax=Magnetospirillum sp. SS-4 TaxID=2681465 RepID=UPI001C2D0656
APEAEIIEIEQRKLKNSYKLKIQLEEISRINRRRGTGIPIPFFGLLQFIKIGSFAVKQNRKSEIKAHHPS